MDYKQAAIAQWSSTPCGSLETHLNVSSASLEYFDELRKSRYELSDTWMKRKIPFSSGKGKKVLEIGFGQGSDLLSWCEAGAEVYGIDLVQRHLDLSLLNFQLHGKKAHLQLADAANIPFPDHTFDIVFSNGVLHHTPDTVRCISESYRVLKPGGLFIFSVYRTYSAFHLLRLLLCHGIWNGNLRKLGYKGLLSTVEKGADGIQIKPLVKTYRKRQLKWMLSDFSKVSFDVAHFKLEHLPKLDRILPRCVEKWLERYLGWYLLAYASK